MKKIFLLISYLYLLNNFNLLAKPSYVVVDYHSKKIFLDKNSDKKRSVASLTKMATAAVVLDWVEVTSLNLNTKIKVPVEVQNIIPPKIPGRLRLLPGDFISIRDALSAAIIASDNVSAQTLAKYIGSQILIANNKDHLLNKETAASEEFVRNMNILAKRLGMKNTRFTNPHGLDQIMRKNAYSTARDIARLTIYVMSKAAFRFYANQKTCIVSLHRFGKKIKFRLKNTNKVLGIDGVDGVKTGQTKKAGPCLVLSAARPNTVKNLPNGKKILTKNRLISVVLGESGDRFAAALHNLNLTWSEYFQWNKEGRMVKTAKEVLSMPKE